MDPTIGLDRPALGRLVSPEWICGQDAIRPAPKSQERTNVRADEVSQQPEIGEFGKVPTHVRRKYAYHATTCTNSDGAAMCARNPPFAPLGGRQQRPDSAMLSAKTTPLCRSAEPMPVRAVIVADDSALGGTIARERRDSHGSG
jgi:hypothetical protein